MQIMTIMINNHLNRIDMYLEIKSFPERKNYATSIMFVAVSPLHKTNSEQCLLIWQKYNRKQH